MIAELLGGNTAEKTLMYLTAMGEGCPTEIARACNISPTQVLRTLERLEGSDIIVSKEMGRTRVYQLNERWVLGEELKKLLEKALLFVPIDEQELYFGKRKKPRKKSKRV